MRVLNYEGRLPWVRPGNADRKDETKITSRNNTIEPKPTAGCQQLLGGGRTNLQEIAVLNENEEKRAQDVFQAEVVQSRGDWKKALHAVLVDLVGRKVLLERPGIPTERPRPLLDKHRALIAQICDRTQADLALACSLGRAGHREGEARGVIVGLFTDAGYDAREIAAGTGIGASVVQNCKTFRKERPGWEALIREFQASPAAKNLNRLPG